MKIIELLNKIANGEEIPKKIKYLNRIYEYKYTTYGTGYLYEDKGIKYWFSEDALSDSAEELNYEVEIIEDEEEIDIQNIEEIVGNTDVRMNNKEISAEDYFYTITNIVLSINELKNKQNESLKAVKQLDKNIKELNK